MLWFITMNGATIGPHEGEVLFAKIHELVAGGQSLAGAHVRDDSGGVWMPIEQSPFANALAPPVPTGKSAKPKNVTAGQAVAVVLVAAFLVWCGTRDSNATSSTRPAAAAEAPKPAHDKIGAWVMAQEFVKRRLKAPGTADFGSVFKDYQNPDHVVTDLGSGKYKVRGWVDSQNGFGATVRSDFALTLHYEGGPEGTWVVDDGPTIEQR
jgi:hypothetical protein